MKPYEFEQLVCDHYRQKGYRVQTTSASNDYGIDVFAEKKGEKIAVQVKMYGGSTRKVNRQTMMELYGAAAYFDCTKAVLATDGEVLTDAKEVAHKLGIDILFIQPDRKISMPSASSAEWSLADIIWEKYIMPLAGKTLTRDNGKTNRIVNVDWSGIERITSNGKHQKIGIEIFRFTMDRLFTTGRITRDEINQNYAKRASSGIVLILSQAPCFRLVKQPAALELAEEYPLYSMVLNHRSRSRTPRWRTRWARCRRMTRTGCPLTCSRSSTRRRCAIPAWRWIRAPHCTSLPRASRPR